MCHEEISFLNLFQVTPISNRQLKDSISTYRRAFKFKTWIEDASVKEDAVIKKCQAEESH